MGIFQWKVTWRKLNVKTFDCGVWLNVFIEFTQYDAWWYINMKVNMTHRQHEAQYWQDINYDAHDNKNIFLVNKNCSGVRKRKMGQGWMFRSAICWKILSYLFILDGSSSKCCCLGVTFCKYLCEYGRCLWFMGWGGALTHWGLGAKIGQEIGLTANTFRSTLVRPQSDTLCRIDV